MLDMKKEMRKIAKKISELEINQSRGSLNSQDKGSEVSIASTRSEPSGNSNIERKLTMHDQWLKDLDLRLQISDTATIDGTLIWKITDYTRRLKKKIDHMSLQKKLAKCNKICLDFIKPPQKKLLSQPYWIILIM